MESTEHTTVHDGNLGYTLYYITLYYIHYITYIKHT